MKVENKKFFRNYEEIERYEAGMVLIGSEVKSIKKGFIRLENAFVKIMDGEAYLINAEIPSYRFSTNPDYEPARRRKLLLHTSELIRLETKILSAGNLTIAPVTCYTKGRHIKLSIALVKARSEIGKKKLVKARDIKRNDKREMKDFMKK